MVSSCFNPETISGEGFGMGWGGVKCRFATQFPGILLRVSRFLRILRMSLICNTIHEDPAKSVEDPKDVIDLQHNSRGSC